MIGQDGIPTKEELETFRTHKNSEFFRIARKMLSAYYGQVCATLPYLKTTEQLQSGQGVLRGLNAAYNLLMSGTAEDPNQKKKKKAEEADEG